MVGLQFLNQPCFFFHQSFFFFLLKIHLLFKATCIQQQHPKKKKDKSFLPTYPPPPLFSFLFFLKQENLKLYLFIFNSGLRFLMTPLHRDILVKQDFPPFIWALEKKSFCSGKGLMHPMGHHDKGLGLFVHLLFDMILLWCSGPK